MEGITGLVDADDVQPGGRDYERGRSMMADQAARHAGGSDRGVRRRAVRRPPPCSASPA
ncbi:M55 family metallopeptidase [Streptomyces sp. NPDC029006]|uniref:M55 family metallopeptidase n=1 Tax=Streptomyces sp. NPDC029006 TaxID=3155467 RepID=UPI0033F2E216